MEVQVEITRKQLREPGRLAEVLNHINLTGEDVPVLKKKGGIVVAIIAPVRGGNDHEDQPVPLDDQPSVVNSR